MYIQGPRHSQFNSTNARIVSKIPLLPITITFKNTALPSPDTQEDIVGEALRLFKSNVLFKNFELHGPADVLLIYLTLFTSQCLNKVIKMTKTEAIKALNMLAVQQLLLPGDANFVLGGFVTAPANAQERQALAQYLTQCRQELVTRLIKLVFGAEDVPSKWWMQFARRKFLNKSF